MDSVTLAYLLASGGLRPAPALRRLRSLALKGLRYAALCANRLGAKFDVVDIFGVGRLAPGSALTDDVPVPHGHYAAQNMALTVVPEPKRHRVPAIAPAVVVAEDVVVVAAGMARRDHYVYPRCRPGFVEALDRMQREAVEGFGDESRCGSRPVRV